MLRDTGDLIAEDFGLPLNLILACSVAIAASVEEALSALAKTLHLTK